MVLIICKVEPAKGLWRLLYPFIMDFLFFVLLSIWFYLFIFISVLSFVYKFHFWINLIYTISTVLELSLYCLTWPKESPINTLKSRFRDGLGIVYLKSNMSGPLSQNFADQGCKSSYSEVVFSFASNLV